MSSSECAWFERTLEEQQDGQLSVAARAHMESCTDCKGLWSDLEAIHSAGMEWGRETVAPPEHLWSSLRAQLESEGLLREQVARRGWVSNWFGTAPRWAVASACVSLLLIAALLANYHGSRLANANDINSTRLLPARLSVPGTRPRLVAADLGTTLDGDLKRVFASLPERNPVLANSLRENLGIVDNLIAVCEKSVREQPNDEMAREYLYGAYEQKAVLLATATDRSASEGQ